MQNKLVAVVVASVFLFVGGTALYDFLFKEKEQAEPSSAVAALAAERDALVAATSSAGTWERFTTIVRSNVVLSASFRVGSDVSYPANAINQHFANSGWSLCKVNEPTALQTFAKGTYRVSLFSGKQGETYRISFSTRLHRNDHDCDRSSR